MAARQTILTDNSAETKVWISLNNHGSAVTVDASALTNANATGDKLHVRRIDWSLDKEINISSTGSGTTDMVNLAGGTAGSFNTHIIRNIATQPGNATDADIVVTPGSGCDGFVYLELLKDPSGW